MKQLTVRHVSKELAKRLDALAEARGKSVNSVVLELLTRAVGLDERVARLERYATWSAEDAAEFDRALAAQRTIDEALWR
jgi:plasmid stability protein